MNYKKMLMVVMAAVAVFSLSGCAAVNKQYSDKVVRAEVKSVTKLADNKVLLSQKAKNEIPEVYAKLEKDKDVLFAIKATTNPPLSKGISWSWTVINPTAVSAQKAAVGDVVDIKLPVVRDDGSVDDVPRVINFVCKTEAPDYAQCFKDPKRGGRYGIINEQTGDISNF